jgi:uncharacterized DUF497 family protein
MLFEWDENKRQENLRKHGVDFADAAEIFEGRIIHSKDSRIDYGEARCRAIGRVGDSYYLVAYTQRHDVLRIISAWKVSKNGIRRYSKLLGE